MTTCQRNTGRLLLAGELGKDREEAFAEHIESCHRCRQWLEQDAGDDMAWQCAQELFIEDDIGAPEQPLHQIAQQIASFLSPSDDPSMMGRLGPYEIVGVIGRGGMGIVLKAFERSLGRNVAIKLLDPPLANLGSARERFAREAKAMAAVSHAHVVPIYAVDQHQDLPYFAMEYVVGETLEHRLRRDGPLGVSSAVRVALQVAEALAAAHSQGLVHRDIKPGNILMDRGTERVRVSDFGLARVACDASQTCSGIVAGTPQYMSPEQVRGASCDGRSDLFSLGSVMYAMCTGHAPFRAETVYGTMQRIAHDLSRSVREQNPDVPPWMESFIDRLLKKEPDQRFDSAAAVATILRGELAHMLNPTQVKQPLRPWEQPRHRPRARWIAYAGTGLLLLAVAVVAGRSGASSKDSSRSSDPFSNAMEPDEKVPRTGKLPLHSSADTAVPLWEVDGTREIRQRASALEDDFRTDSQSRDNWRQDVDAIRQQLTNLLQEPF